MFNFCENKFFEYLWVDLVITFPIVNFYNIIYLVYPVV